MEAKFTYDSSESALGDLFDQLYPNRRLIAEGMDNNGSLPPLAAEDLTAEQVKVDIRYATRAAI